MADDRLHPDPIVRLTYWVKRAEAAEARIARMQREPAYRDDAFELVERELLDAADMAQITINAMEADRVSIQLFAHDALIAESAGSTLLAAVVALKAEP